MIDKNTVLQLAPADKLPIAVDCPIDDLMALYRLAVKMEKLCTDEDGIGLSAVQVGLPWRFFIVRRGKQYEYYLNCEYAGMGAKQSSIEGCLSLKTPEGVLRRFEVQRFPSVKIKGKRLRLSSQPGLVLEDFEETETGLYAVVFQHEIDHGFQVLISDIGKEIEFIR